MSPQQREALLYAAEWMENNVSESYGQLLRSLAEEVQAEPVAYLYQHDETGRTTLRMADERMSERRWHEIPLYAKAE